MDLKQNRTKVNPLIWGDRDGSLVRGEPRSISPICELEYARSFRDRSFVLRPPTRAVLVMMVVYDRRTRNLISRASY